MPAALVIHLDRLVRERIAAALTVRGMDVRVAPDVESGLLFVDEIVPNVVLIDPRILLREDFDIGTRFTVRVGKPVRLVALTHVAGAVEAAAFQKHGATLLIQPVEDTEMLSIFVGAPGKPMGLAEAEARRAVVRKGNTVTAVSNVPPSAEEASLIAPRRPDGQGPLVLIVDDDPDCRELFCDALISKGYQTHDCSSVPAAFRYIRAGHPVELVVSDIHMSIFDGFEFKDELDRTAERSIPFIAITGEDNAEKYELALRLGAVALLSKPVSLRRFFRLVRATLDRAAAEAAAAGKLR